jgi:hypothetical protein
MIDRTTGPDHSTPLANRETKLASPAVNLALWFYSAHLINDFTLSDGTCRSATRVRSDPRACLIWFPPREASCLLLTTRGGFTRALAAILVGQSALVFATRITSRFSLAGGGRLRDLLRNHWVPRRRR